MKLAIAQIVLGLLITIFSFISTRWGFPTEFALPPDESGLIHSVLVNPGPVQVLAQISALVALVLGLVVLGVGIAQLVKARK